MPEDDERQDGAGSVESRVGDAPSDTQAHPAGGDATDAAQETPQKSETDIALEERNYWKQRAQSEEGRNRVRDSDPAFQSLKASNQKNAEYIRKLLIGQLESNQFLDEGEKRRQIKAIEDDYAEQSRAEVFTEERDEMAQHMNEVVAMSQVPLEDERIQSLASEWDGVNDAKSLQTFQRRFNTTMLAVLMEHQKNALNAKDEEAKAIRQRFNLENGILDSGGVDSSPAGNRRRFTRGEIENMTPDEYARNREQLLAGR